jgi:hypothetical protein
MCPFTILTVHIDNSQQHYDTLLPERSVGAQVARVK